MKKKNTEVQSRRDFFKKAAKATLPIFGVAVLFNFPLHKAMASTECTACEGGCQGSCSGTCSGNCRGECNTSCQGTCSDSCKGDCSNVCKY